MRFVLLLGILVAALQRPGQPEIRIPDLERRVHELVNAERVKNHLSALRFDDELTKIARAHSADMAKRGYFAHETPEGKDASDRGRRAGYLCRKFYGQSFTDGLAENIYQGNLYSRVFITGDKKTYDWYSLQEIAADTVEGWMNSAGHRRNILENNYDREGIGIAIGDDDRVYVTQDFC